MPRKTRDKHGRRDPPDWREMSKISSNSVSLAGEFAVLSQLALRGYDANMTLGNTKSVDILVSNPNTGKMYQLEVKTNHKNTRNQRTKSRFSESRGVLG